MTVRDRMAWADRRIFRSRVVEALATFGDTQDIRGAFFQQPREVNLPGGSLMSIGLSFECRYVPEIANLAVGEPFTVEGYGLPLPARTHPWRRRVRPHRDRAGRDARMSVRDQIRDRVITELNAANPTGVPDATKRRYIPGSKIVEPRIAVFFAEEQTSRVNGRGGNLTRRNLTIAVQAVIVVEDPADADDTMEPLLEHVVDVLGDTTLAGLATDVEEVGTQWGGDSSSGLYILMAIMRWRVEFQTVRNDLTRKQ